MFAVAFEFDYLAAGVAAIALALVAVAMPILMLKPFRNFS